MRIAYLEWQEKQTLQGKDVPTQTEIAQAINTTQPELSRLFNNRLGSINRSLIQKLVHYLRQRGFDPQPNDLIRFD